MVIDSSALIAILLNEPEREPFTDQIELATIRLVSVASILETSIVLTVKFGKSQDQEVDNLLAILSADLMPVDRDQLALARKAFHRYGKGHHPARLNFGDCFSYALAKQTGEPLLYKGTDFSLTDISSAVKP